MVKAFLKKAWKRARLGARELASPLRHEIEMRLERELPREYWKVVKRIARHPVVKRSPWKEHTLELFIRKPLQEGIPPAEILRCWEIISKEILPAASKRAPIYEEVFLYSEGKNLNRNPEALRIVATELLPHVEVDYWKDIFHSLPEYFKQKPTVQHLREQIELAKQYQTTGKYFYQRTGAANFGKLHPIGGAIAKRYQFPKTGSRIMPLGGKLHGYIVRTLPREAYEAWLAAHNAGLQVEEIMHRKCKPVAYPTSDGMMRVYTRFGGEHHKKFLRENPGHWQEVRRQIEQIKTGLAELGINHGHFDNNLVVKMVNGKPLVRVIDFDAAKLKKDK